MSFTCCLPWFWEADADSEQEPSQVLRHHRLSEPRLARKVLKEPEVVECAEGAEREVLKSMSIDGKSMEIK